MSEDRLFPADWQRGPATAAPTRSLAVPPHATSRRRTSPSSACRWTWPRFTARGARFGPRAIRDASGQLRPHHWDPAKLEPPFDKLRVIDYGDLDVFPGYIEQTVEHLQTDLAADLRRGRIPRRPRR